MQTHEDMNQKNTTKLGQLQASAIVEPVEKCHKLGYKMS